MTFFLVYPERLNEIPGVHYENKRQTVSSIYLHLPSIAFKTMEPCFSQHDSASDPHIIHHSILREKPKYAVCDGSNVVDVCGHFYVPPFFFSSSFYV